MNCKCETIIFSDRAYNAIIRESFSKHPLETGGKLLGYISADGKIWFVMEALSAGVNATHQIAYFQYDKAFIDYLSTSIANQYQASLQDLGLWHRHPGSMDTFSSTDDITNVEHASRNPYGIISGLVNIDPKFRLTLYYLNHQRIDSTQRVPYSKITDILVGDAYIPKEFFALRYVEPEDIELHPLPPASMRPFLPQQQDQNPIDEFKDGEIKPWPPKDLDIKRDIVRRKLLNYNPVRLKDTKHELIPAPPAGYDYPLPPKGILPNPTIRKRILFSGLAIIFAVVFFIIGSYTKEKEITKLTEENKTLNQQLRECNFSLSTKPSPRPSPILSDTDSTISAKPTDTTKQAKNTNR